MRYSFNSHLLFVFFFLLAVIKPINLENINRYMGILLMLLLTLVFLISYFRDYNYRHLHSKYLFEIILIVLFLMVNFISLWLNQERFDSIISIVIFGFASMAVWSAFFMSWLIYSDNHYSNGRWLGWGLVLFLAFVAWWQLYDYSGATQLTQYFVSADAHTAKGISSITRWHTIYGVIAAVGIIVVLQTMMRVRNDWWARIVYLLIICLFAYTGLLGESRNFLFTLAIGLLLLVLQYFYRHPKTILLLVLICVAAVHALLLNNERLMRDYGQIFPYIHKFKQAQLPSYDDFIPKINNHSLTGREDLWRQGYRLWQQSPWIGIGAGSYRAMNQDDEQHRNLHNFYFQVLVDTGVIGFSILLLLLVLLLRRAYRANNMLILITIMASLLFDNYLDYSFAWVFIMSWFLFVSQSGSQTEAIKI